jgi:hypothetical protein
VGFCAASHRARDQNLGALKGFLSAYGETLPVAGKSKHKKAVLRDCEIARTERERRGALLTERHIRLREVARMRRIVHTWNVPLASSASLEAPGFALRACAGPPKGRALGRGRERYTARYITVHRARSCTGFRHQPRGRAQSPFPWHLKECEGSWYRLRIA